MQRRAFWVVLCGTINRYLNPMQTTLRIIVFAKWSMCSGNRGTYHYGNSVGHTKGVANAT